jgi:hypothetical protein
MVLKAILMLPAAKITETSIAKRIHPLELLLA